MTPENVGRLLPGEPFPPYSYVPGRYPHPESDPAGHSFNLPRPTPPPIDADDWPASRTYLRGLDLFNHGFYWESHVEFEGLWLACGRTGTAALFLKGLIKLAAAGVKHLEGKPEGIRSHAARAAQLWREVALERGAERYLGFRLPAMVELAETIDRDGWPEPPPVLLPILPPPAS